MTRTCTTCGVVGGAETFYRGSHHHSGLHPRCKSCHSTWLQEPTRKARTQAVRRRLVYNLPPEQHAEILARQGGGCAICGEVKKLCVDHDHACCPAGGSCGKCVRGLLCYSCNLALGKLENPIFAAAAAKYQAAHRRIDLALVAS